MNLNEFNKLEFNKLTFEELQNIGSTIGISKSSTRYCKEIEIYNKIKYLLNIKDQLEKRQQLNPFNKYIPVLEFKENLEPVELLFWRVFRDKCLFKQIFSNFKPDVYGYYQLIDINDIVDNFTNSKAIIKDRLLYSSEQLPLLNTNSSQYTTFTPNKKDSFRIKNKKDRPNKFEVICKLFKTDNNDNQKIFNKIFTSYNNTLFNSNESTVLQLKSILSTYNLMALNQLIQYYSSDKDKLEYIILNFNLYYSNLGWTSPRFSNIKFLKSYGDIKKFNFLKSIKNSNIKLIKDDENEFVKDNNITVRVQFSRELFTLFTKIKHLQKMYLMIVNNNLNNINNNENSIAINEINQIINRNHLNNSSTFLNHKLDSSFSIDYKIKEDKLLDYIIKILNLFKTATTEDQEKRYIDQIINELKELEKEREITTSYERRNCLYLNIQSTKLFIEHLKKDTDYIYLTFDNTKLSRTFKMKLLQWVRGCISGDNRNVNNLESLKEHMNKTKLEKTFEHYSSDFLLEVKSKEELDFYFINYKDIFYGNNNSNWKYLKSIELLEYYEEKMKSLGRFMEVNSLDPEASILIFKYIDSPLDRILRAIDDPSVYKFRLSFKLESYHQIVSSYFNLGKSEIIIKLFEKLEIKNYVVPVLKERRPLNINNNSFFKWIIQNYKAIKDYSIDSILTIQLSLSKSIDFIFEEINFINILCFNNLHKDIIINLKYRIDYQLFMDIIINNNYLSFEFIDVIIKLYVDNRVSNTLDIKNIIVGFFIYASIYGSISVFKLLFLKYSSIIFSKNNRNKFIEISNFKDCLKYSIQCGNIEIAELLSNYCKLTENEFTKFISPTSHSIGYNHFKDKFIIKDEEDNY